MPLAGLLGAGFVGLIDDIMNIRASSRIAGMGAKLSFCRIVWSRLRWAGGSTTNWTATSIYLAVAASAAAGRGVVRLFWFVVVATANSVNISDGTRRAIGGY